MTIPVEIKPEVKDAINCGTPVVALETSIVAQGLPYPDNLETAFEIERTVARANATPASVAVVGGTIRVGLGEPELEFLATGKNVRKLSRADLSTAIALGETGATTVSATMICAQAAGIKVFATGGIGGVHRGAEVSFDISQDLRELAETAVIVVSSGAKAILDIPKTLEVLETLGVPVVTFGQDDFPAFWSRSSGMRSPLRLDDPETVIQAQLAREHLGLRGGMLVANPIPEFAEISIETVRYWLADALSQAKRQGVAGKAVTPFLLGAIAERSDGKSISSNKVLVSNNAKLASEIAVAYSAKLH